MFLASPIFLLQPGPDPEQSAADRSAYPYSKFLHETRKRIVVIAPSALFELAIERTALDAEDGGGAAFVAVHRVQDVTNVVLFGLGQGGQVLSVRGHVRQQRGGL